MPDVWVGCGVDLDLKSKCLSKYRSIVDEKMAELPFAVARIVLMHETWQNVAKKSRNEIPATSEHKYRPPHSS